MNGNLRRVWWFSSSVGLVILAASEEFKSSLAEIGVASKAKKKQTVYIAVISLGMQFLKYFLVEM